jgi:hypothetical protein
MLKVLKIGQGGSAVVLTCDSCGECITHPHCAYYTWRELHTTSVEDAQLQSLVELLSWPLYVDEGQIYTLHQGDCLKRFQATHGGDAYRWPLVRLSYLPGLLIHNLGMTFPLAEEQFHALDKMGV